MEDAAQFLHITFNYYASVADEHGVEHPTTTDYLDDKDTEKFFYPDD